MSEIPPILFVSGTDTGVGKTLVTALVALRLQLLGARIGVMKPFASGCIWNENRVLESEDAVFLRKAVGVKDSLDLINPCRWEEALSPLVAARRAAISARNGDSFCVENAARDEEFADAEMSQLAVWDVWQSALGELKSRYDCVVVEGVGGLLAPIGEIGIDEIARDENASAEIARDESSINGKSLNQNVRREAESANSTLKSADFAPRVHEIEYSKREVSSAETAPKVAAPRGIWTNVEVANALGAPVILVARRTLGTINHTVLTSRIELQKPAHFAGIVWCDAAPVAENDVAANTSADIVEEMMGLARFGEVPFLDSTEIHVLVDAAQRFLSWPN